MIKTFSLLVLIIVTTILFFKTNMKKRDDKVELDKTYKTYKKSVNMTYSQMKKWAENSWSRKASLTRAPVL